MAHEPHDPRGMSRRKMLALGAASAGAAALGAGLPGTAQAAPRAAVGGAAARRGAAPAVLTNSTQGPPNGSSLALSQNWDFGANGNIPDINTMNTLFQYHDQFGQFNNGGGNYGADTVAPDAATALSGQPIEDPANPVRAFTADSLQTYLVPLNGATTVDPPDHNVGCGSFVAQYTLPNGGALLGQHLMWETRVRYVTPPYFWFAIWTSGNIWNNGAEMDVIESFGYDNGGGNTNFNGQFWHSDSVGGADNIGYGDWGGTMAYLGITDYDATQYHVWQWWYLADDSYVVVVDGIVVQSGSIHWTNGGVEGGTPINMTFLFDGAWGHTQVGSVDHSLDASQLAGTLYEWDYSRIYLSDPSNTGWQPFQSLSADTGFAPAAASLAAGELDLFNVGTDNALWHKSYSNGGWAANWDFIGGTWTSSPAAVATGDGTINVFARGTDNVIWQNTYNGSSWSGWVSLGGGPFVSGPAAASWGVGRIDVFAIDNGNNLLHGTIDSSGWTGWTDNTLGLPSSGPLTSDPAATSSLNGQLDVFGRGSDNNLWIISYDSGSWGPWQNLGGTLAQGPAAASWAPARLDAFAVGTDNGLYQLTYNAGWGNWVSLGGGGNLVSNPSAACWSIGRTDVFTTATDGTIWQTSYV